MKRFRLCWTNEGMELAEQEGHQGVMRIAPVEYKDAIAAAEKLKALGFTEVEHGWLAPRFCTHGSFIAAVEWALEPQANNGDHSVYAAVKELFAKADALEDQAKIIREQGRALDQELRRRIEPRVDQWLEGLISSTELIDVLQIEKRRL